MRGIQETPVKVFSCYKDMPRHLTPIVLTIGNFDAVHLGHCAVLKNAKKIADDIDGHLCVLTFSSHPIEVLRPGTTLPKLCTQLHKLSLFEKQNVDVVIFFEFTVSFSLQTAAEFLSSLHGYISFDALVLGHDALVGKDRLGDSAEMQEIAVQLGFKLNYVPPYQVDGTLVSSSAIRRAIQIGDLDNAEKMVGRKFSVLTEVAVVNELQVILADASSLCLPPEGVYPVKVVGGVDPEGVFAEAIVMKGFPYLELNFEDGHLCYIGQQIEVIF
ncbi:MAG: FAD synthetase family protein [Parachlamydiaceae bacterium]|nr:FAD synthetase family protein [Parachlamydiaceae bacterium]